MKFGTGQSPKRIEDPTLVSGRGRYTDDVHVPGAAHGYVLRSTIAHGVLTRLDAAAARAAPGVLAVLTRDEIEADGVGPIACLTQIKNADGSDHHRTPFPVLATDRVRFAGQPLAFVVAETLSQAKDAAELIEVEIDELPVETDTFAAAQPGAHQIWDHIPGNVVFDYARGDKAEVDAVFDKADRVTTVKLVNNRLVCNAIEPRAAVAEVTDSGRFQLHVPSQGPFFLMNQLCGMLGIEAKDLRLLTGNVGGGFGTKAFLYPEPVMTLWAAKRLGRSVRWAGERMEIFLSDVHGRDNITDRRTGHGRRRHVPGAAGHDLWRDGGISLELRADDPDRRLGRHVHRPVPHSEGVDQREGRDHQHGPGRCLPRRRPARGGLSDRAAGRRHSTRDGPDPG